VKPEAVIGWASERISLSAADAVRLAEKWLKLMLIYCERKILLFKQAGQSK
jgi:hypothetical protein